MFGDCVGVKFIFEFLLRNLGFDEKWSVVLNMYFSINNKIGKYKIANGITLIVFAIFFVSF